MTDQSMTAQRIVNFVQSNISYIERFILCQVHSMMMACMEGDINLQVHVWLAERNSIIWC